MQKNKNSFVSEYAENIKKRMQNRKCDIPNQKYITQNARNEFWNKLAINNKTEYSADEYKTFIVEYINGIFSIQFLCIFNGVSDVYHILQKMEYDNITISGIEFGNTKNYEIYNSLFLEKNKTNIVVMHGQEAETDIKDKADIINLKQLKNKNIDYLALGHIHTHKLEKLDNRGVYCYSGCLEGRGFDECGEKGFVILNIDEGKITTEFVPFAYRNLYEVHVDLTGATENNDIEEKIKEKIDGISQTSLVKIVLEGEVEIGEERDIDYFAKKFGTNFYFLKIEDKPKIKIDYMKYKNDISLKGEFIRLVLEQKDLSEEEKSRVIYTGIKALRGEE